ncbi:MAG: hypothetical protein Q9169_004500 [Polycauliona sp. 2 TL-2023]
METWKIKSVGGGHVIDSLTALSSNFAFRIKCTTFPADGDQVRATSRRETLDVLMMLQLSHSPFTARKSGAQLVSHQAFDSSTNSTGAHNSALPNGSPRSPPKTRPRSSRMSRSSSCLDEHECAISSNTKVCSSPLRRSSSPNKNLPDTKVVYRRYASLFFIAGCSSTDNELITLEIVHRYVEQMDKYYGNVCELDIIFNFQKAYFILDELLLAGEMQESSKKNVLRCISQQDSLEDMEVSLKPFNMSRS